MGTAGQVLSRGVWAGDGSRQHVSAHIGTPDARLAACVKAAPPVGAPLSHAQPRGQLYQTTLKLSPVHTPPHAPPHTISRMRDYIHPALPSSTLPPAYPRTPKQLPDWVPKANG